jgi:hypothetical protein
MGGGVVAPKKRKNSTPKKYNKILIACNIWVSGGSVTEDPDFGILKDGS